MPAINCSSAFRQAAWVGSSASAPSWASLDPLRGTDPGRGRLLAAGQTGKMLMGAGAIAVAVLILTGADRGLETILVDASPAWLTDLTTRF